MTHPFELRRVGPGDLALLTAADPRLADTPAHSRHIGELLGAGLSWAVMGEAGASGFAVVTRHFFGYPFVDLLLVAAGERRRGVGLALLAACEGAHESDRIFTSTNESSDPMRRLLAKADWQVSGVIENLDPGDPELVYVKFKVPG